MSPTSFQVIETMDFIQAKPCHENFIMKSFTKGLIGSGWSQVREAEKKLINALHANLGTTITAVISKDPDLFTGWAHAQDGKLVWVYVVKSFRKLGIGAHLISKVLPDVAPVPCLFWSHDAACLARNGFPLFFNAQKQRRNQWHNES